MRKRFEVNLVSKYRQEIYGIAAIWVMLSHVADYKLVNFESAGRFGTIVATIFLHGNMSVDIFLFLSGISLYYTWTKNSDLDMFYHSRANRILPSYLITMCCAGIIQMIFHLGVKPHSYLLALSGMEILIDGVRSAPWYASCIMLFYLIFPAIYVFIYGKEKKYHFLRTLFLLFFLYGFIFSMHRLNPDYFNKIEIILTRLPVFVIGVYAGKLVKKGSSFNIAMWIPCILAFVAYLYFRLNFDVWYSRVIYLVGAIPLAYIFSIIFKFIDARKNIVAQGILKGLRKLGGVSFELYLTHFLFVRLFMAWKGPFGFFFMMFALFVSVSSAFLVRKASVKLTSKNAFDKVKLK